MRNSFGCETPRVLIELLDKVKWVGMLLMSQIDLGQIFTKKCVAEFMVSLFSTPKTAKILDPCFGGGVFMDCLLQNGYENISGYEIDSSLFEFVRSAPKFKHLALYQCDFLSASQKVKYDGIIMNPPYIRQEKINYLAPMGITKSRLRRYSIYNELPKTANLYMYFIAKAIELLKFNGELIVIFPSSWLKSSNGLDFQKYMNSKCTIVQHIHLSGEIFEKNALVEVIILKLVKGIHTYPIVQQSFKVHQGTFQALHYNHTTAALDFIVPFSALANVRRGIMTGYNSMFINPPLFDLQSKQHLKEIVSSPKSIRGYSTENATVDTLFVYNSTLPSTPAIDTYLSHWQNTIRSQQKPKTIYNKIDSNPNWYKLNPIVSSGILFSYFVRNDMKFILNPHNYLARDNFYIITPKISISLLFSLLNSYYTYYQLELSGKRYGAGLLKLQRYDIINLVFPAVEKFSQQDILKLEELASDLATSGNSGIIDEITKTIATYSTIEYGYIKEQYKKAKKARLEQIWQ